MSNLGGESQGTDGDHPLRREFILPREVLDRVREVRSVQRAADVDLLLLACDWADRHPFLDDSDSAHDHIAARQSQRDEQRRIAAGWLAGQESGLPDDYVWLGPDEIPEDPWVPLVDARAFASFGAALGASSAAGERWIRDGLLLRHRMPQLHAAVLAGRVEVWRARRIAQRAWREPADVVDALDAAVTPRAHSIGVSGLDRLIDEILLRLYPEERELDQVAEREAWHVTMQTAPTPSGSAELSIRMDYVAAAEFDRACSVIAEIIKERQEAEGRFPESVGERRATAVGILADPARALALLHGLDRGTAPEGDSPEVVLDPDRPLATGIQIVVHLTPEALAGRDPVVQIGRRGSRGSGGVLRPQLAQLVADWCGRPAASIQVLPVVDLTSHHESESLSASEKLRVRTHLRRPTCVFPWCERPSGVCDADHCVPAGAGGPSCDCNLQPLCRSHHRLKTHSSWSYTPLETETLTTAPSATESPATESPATESPATGPLGADPATLHPGAAVSWLWRSPFGHAFLVDAQGTRDVTPTSRDGERATSSVGGTAPLA